MRATKTDVLCTRVLCLRQRRGTEGGARSRVAQAATRIECGSRSRYRSRGLGTHAHVHMIADAMLLMLGGCRGLTQRAYKYGVCF